MARESVTNLEPPRQRGVFLDRLPELVQGRGARDLQTACEARLEHVGRIERSLGFAPAAGSECVSSMPVPGRVPQSDVQVQNLVDLINEGDRVGRFFQVEDEVPHLFFE